MPDISMCGDTTCPSKSQCYRFMAEASNFQTYSTFDRAGSDKCASFMEWWGGKQGRPLPSPTDTEKS